MKEEQTTVKLLERVLKIVEHVAWVFFLGSMAAIISLFLLILIDVLIRVIIGISLKGEVEISEYLLVFIGFMGLGYAQLARGHVNIDFLVTRLSPMLKAIMDIVVLLILSVFSAVMAWQIGKEAWVAWVEEIYRSGTSMLTPTWPPNLIASTGCIMLTFCFLTQILRNLIDLMTGNLSGLEHRTGKEDLA